MDAKDVDMGDGDCSPNPACRRGQPGTTSLSDADIQRLHEKETDPSLKAYLAEELKRRQINSNPTIGEPPDHKRQ